MQIPMYLAVVSGVGEDNKKPRAAYPNVRQTEVYLSGYSSNAKSDIVAGIFVAVPESRPTLEEVIRTAFSFNATSEKAVDEAANYGYLIDTSVVNLLFDKWRE